MKKLLLTGIICSIQLFSFAQSYSSPQVMLKEVFLDLKKVAEFDGARDFFLDSIQIVYTTDKVAFQINNQIGIEEKALNICWEWGERAPDALAALLSHEIAHFLYHFQEPITPVEFAGLNRSQDNPETLKKIESLETEADEKGIFLAFRAGYRVDDILPELQKMIYKKYGLPDDLPGYPSLMTRQKLARDASIKAEILANVFTSANYLTISRQYDDAALAYSYINNHNRSKEFLNNTGVLYALEALEILKNDFQFIYPFELDGKNRFKTQGRSYHNQPERTNELLEHATFYLNKSKQMAPEYLPAWINFAAINDLKGESLDAEYAIEKALSLIQKQKITSPKILTDVYITRAIIYAHKGQKVSAKKYLKMAEKFNLPSMKKTIKHNQRLIAGKDMSAPIPPPNEFIPNDKYEVLLNFPLEKIQQILPADTTIYLETNPDCFLRIRDTSDTKILIFQEGKLEAESQVFLHITNSNFQDKSVHGIKIGDSWDMVHKAYKGYFSYQLNSPEGIYLIYPGPGIIFEIGKDEKVMNWCIYMVF